jgi:hypothetical protein
MPNAHVETLNARHARLDAKLEEERRRPLPDAVRLTSLKREKLLLKEELSRGSHTL